MNKLKTKPKFLSILVWAVHLLLYIINGIFWYTINGRQTLSSASNGFKSAL